MFLKEEAARLKAPLLVVGFPLLISDCIDVSRPIIGEFVANVRVEVVEKNADGNTSDRDGVTVRSGLMAFEWCLTLHRSAMCFCKSLTLLGHVLQAIAFCEPFD